MRVCIIIENSGKIVAKGEIAHYKQFILLSKYFQKSSAAEASKHVLQVGKG